MNDGTFDNRGFSPGRIVFGTIGVVAFLIALLPAAAMGPIGIMIVGVAVVAGIMWYRRRRRSKLLERMPTTPIGELRGGYVEVSGNATRLDERELRDPVRNELCLWFGVETQREEKGSIRMWLPFKRAASSRQFRLRDESGSSCLIDPRGAQFVLRAPIDVAVNERVRHRIWRILEGDVITVVGQADSSGDGWRLRCADGGRYLVTDESADGGIGN